MWGHKLQKYFCTYCKYSTVVLWGHTYVVPPLRVKQFAHKHVRLDLWARQPRGDKSKMMKRTDKTRISLDDQTWDCQDPKPWEVLLSS